jgi:streptogramin lyase
MTTLRRVALGVFTTLALFPAASHAAPTLEEHSIPRGNALAKDVAAGPDGNLWFTEYDRGKIARMTPWGIVTEFDTPSDGAPEGIVTGPDGNLWFTDADKNVVVRSTTAGTMTAFPVTVGTPHDIAVGPDGNLWFTEGTGAIGRITPAGVLTEFTFGLSTGATPSGIAAGPDGNLWFTDNSSPGRIGRITPAGVIAEWPTTTVDSMPMGIAAGSDGNLWFTEKAGNAIGRITPSGVITEFQTGLAPGSQPYAIAAAGDGSLYFSDRGGAGAIGRVLTDGTISRYPTPSAWSSPAGLAEGPDGNIWFTESAEPTQLGRATVAPAVANTVAGPIADTSATFQAAIRANKQTTQYSFEYGTTTAYGSATTAKPAGVSGVSGTFTATATGLAAATTYHFRVVATNATGTTYGPDQVLTTALLPPLLPALAPSVENTVATGVTDTGASLQAELNAQGLATQYYFEYGATAAYGTQSAVLNGGLLSAAQTFTLAIAGLAPRTTYHFRVVATNLTGTTVGPDATFETTAPPPVAPIVSNTWSSHITPQSAKLRADIDADGQRTEYWFEFGETNAYGLATAKASAGNAAGVIGYYDLVSTLSSSTTYHFRVVASNPTGTTYGPDKTLVTAPVAPLVTNSTASGITHESAELGTDIDADAQATQYRFEYGPSAAYGSQTAMLPAGNAKGAKRFAVQVGGLAASTKYHARVVATNATGTTAAADFIFATASAPDRVAAPPADLTKPATDAAPPATTAPPTAGPELGKTIGIARVTGAVRVKVAGESNFTNLPGEGSALPSGSIVDATKGVARLFTALPGGATQVATLWRGAVRVRQSSNGMTDLYLYGALRCGRTAGASRASKRGGKERLIWVKDNSGRFRSHGRNSVATVRGTKWLTRDTCGGTLTKVAQGKVAVRDLHTRRTVLVRAGKSYFARTR